MFKEKICSYYKYKHLIFYSVLKKLIFAILIHSAWRIHSAGDIYLNTTNTLLNWRDV